MKFKNSGSIWLLIIALSFLISCKRDCYWGVLNGVSIETLDSLSDTLVVINKMEAGSNYTKLISSDTFRGKQIYHQSRMYADVSYPFEGAYAYVMYILPAGREYKIRNVSSDHDKGEGGLSGSSSMLCVSGSSYIINDSVVYFPKTLSSAYYVHSVWIKY